MFRLNLWATGMLAAALGGRSLAAPMVTVSGWDFSTVHETGTLIDFGHDPVVGRLICPPLTRLDIHDKGSEPFVLKNLIVSADNREWAMALRPNVLWWSGEPATSEDLKKFIHGLFSAGPLKERVEALWSIPGFEVETTGPNSIRVLWKSPPVFGPFVLDGFSFSRAAAAAQKAKSLIDFECVGRYSARLEGQSSSESLILEPTKSLGGAQRSIRLMSQAPKGKDDPNAVDFKTASQVDRDLGPKGVQESSSCSARLELPVMTLILWNSSRTIAKEAAMRKVFTQLIPRGELLRTGAGGFGELLSAPLPRSHPGYDNSLKVRSFSIEEAAASLDALGYRRSSPEKSRGDKSGEVLKMVVATLMGSSGLAEKIVSDSFNAVGIDLRIESEEKSQPEKVDGQLLSWSVPWPAINLATVFHSRSRHKWQAWLPHTKQLDDLLEQYALSLSRGQPNYSNLRLIHRELFELEPVTVLMQHKACVKVGSSFAGKAAHLDVRDPDWFWHLIF